MNDATLQSFRDLAAAMTTEPQTWQWVGAHMSQRMFGITERRAKDYAARFGGAASPMALVEETDEAACASCGDPLKARDGSRQCFACRSGK